MSTCVYAPASMGNVSAGFDLLGAALQPIDGSLLGDRVWVAAGDDGLSLTCCGPYKDVLPEVAEENIVFRCAQVFLARTGNEDRALELKLEKNLPIGSGLGSSASSVVAALGALNAHFGNPLEQAELLEMMGQLEGEISGAVHYDNVAPSYLGGMRLMLDESNVPDIPVFDHWYWVVAYPGTVLSTAKMRQLLPQDVSLKTALAFGQNLTAFVDACHRKDESQALSALKDVIAEPYRAPHLPRYEYAREQLGRLGCASVGISGSGPTLFAVCQSIDVAKQAADFLEQEYLVNERGLVRVCKLAQDGIQVEEK